MACSVTIDSVNLATDAGGAQEFRIIGTVTGCSAQQLTVDYAAGGVSQVFSVPTDGRFVVGLPIVAGSVACDSHVSITASCGTTCQATFAQTVPCCQFLGVTVVGVVTPGNLAPTSLRVSGVALGCYTVNITPPTGIASAVTATVQPYGDFTVDLPLNTPVTCDQTIDVDISCGTACSPATVRMNCAQCARAQVSYTTAPLPCVGTPPRRAATLSAIISVAKGAGVHLRWQYGDGTLGPVFLVDNHAGTAASQYTVTDPPHSYAAGSYTAFLIVTDANGNPRENCDKIPLTVTISCSTTTTTCPTLTFVPDPNPPCVNGMRRVTFRSSVNPFPTNGAVFVWSFHGGAIVPGGGDFDAPFIASGPLPDYVVDYPPSATTYSASLTCPSAANCPAVTAVVTADDCGSQQPACCPTIRQDAPNIAGCGPQNATAAFSVTQPIAWSAGCTPMQVQSYQWTLDGPNNNPTVSPRTYNLTTTQAVAAASDQWRDTASGQIGPVQLASGDYSVTVLAVFATALDTSCAFPMDSKPFTVPSCCPQLIGPLNASPKSGDPCTWLFSAQVANAGGAPVTYKWTFQDGSTATTSVPQVEHTYAVGTTTSGTTTLTMSSPGCPDTTLSTPVKVSCTSTTTTTPGTTPTPTSGSGGGMGCLCILLLSTAIALLLIASFLTLGAICTANIPIGIAAGVAYVLALAVFIVWVILCGSSPAACGVLGTLECVVDWIILAIVVLFIVLGVLALTTAGVTFWCALGAVVVGFEWGLVLLIITQVEARLKCPRVVCG